MPSPKETGSPETFVPRLEPTGVFTDHPDLGVRVEVVRDPAYVEPTEAEQMAAHLPTIDRYRNAAETQFGPEAGSLLTGQMIIDTTRSIEVEAERPGHDLLVRMGPIPVADPQPQS